MSYASFTPATTALKYITFSPSVTGSVLLYGYMFEHTTNVFLSTTGSISLTGLTAVDHFSNIHRVSAICPAFSGYEISTYDILDSNRLIVNLHNISASNPVDIIWYNKAGYTKLSNENYLIVLT